MCVTCKACGTKGAVRNSRLQDGNARRRRVCKTCGARWNTFELGEAEYRALKAAEKALQASLREAKIRCEKLIIEEARFHQQRNRL